MAGLVCTKVCKDCGLTRPVTDYRKRPRNRDGRDNRCRFCMREWDQGWSRQKKASDPGRYRSYARKAAAIRRRDFPTEEREKFRRWYHSHLEEQRARSRANSMRRHAFKLGTLTERVSYAAILARDGMWCYLCERPIEGAFEYDHVTPLSRGGTHTFGNIKITHRRCNRAKHDKLLAELTLPLRDKQ